MLFITNRKMDQGALDKTLVRFDLGENAPAQQVYFCQRTTIRVPDLYAQLGSEEFVNVLASAPADHILFYIHGFSNLPEDDIFPRAKQLQELVGTHILVVPIIWPCDNDLGVIKDYWDDQKSADASGQSFARAMQFLIEKSTSRLCNKKVSILAHSMGNRVLRETLVHWKYYHSPAGVPLMFDNIFMVAADVVNETLEKGERGDVIAQSTKRVVVYHAADDRALRASKIHNLKNRIASLRLGHTGVENPEKSRKNVLSIDCNRYNSEYDPIVGHTYFLDTGEGRLKPGKVLLHLKDIMLFGKVSLQI